MHCPVRRGRPPGSSGAPHPGRPAHHAQQFREQRRLIGLRIDIETRSRVPIKYGSYCYAECPDFAALVIAYSKIYRYPGGAEKIRPPRTLDLTELDPATGAPIRTIIKTTDPEKYDIRVRDYIV